MAKFITRILLLKGEEKDYETLHREIAKDHAVLKKKKMNKLVGDTSTKALKSVGKAPTKVLIGETPIKAVEYNYWGNISLKDVADAVVRAVRKTGRDYSFTIMKDKSDYKLL